MQHNQLPIAILQSKSIQYIVLTLCILSVVFILSKYFGVNKEDVRVVADEVV